MTSKNTDEMRLKIAKALNDFKSGTVDYIRTSQAIENLFTHYLAEARYCGICYKPCIQHGGWKCHIHGYESSILITSHEAEKLRSLAEAEREAELTNIKDWTRRGLDSTNTDVWFRCLQMIETELNKAKGKK